MSRDGFRALAACEAQRDEARVIAGQRMSERDQALAERDALADLRRDVVMALCVEDDDEERTDAEVVMRIRELVSSEIGAAQEIDAARHATAVVERERDSLARRLAVRYQELTEARQEAERLRGGITRILESRIIHPSDHVNPDQRHLANVARLSQLGDRLRALASTGGSDTTGADNA